MPQRVEIQIRELQRQQISDLWSIDRTEVVEKVYYRKGDELVSIEWESDDAEARPAACEEPFGHVRPDVSIVEPDIPSRSLTDVDAPRHSQPFVDVSVHPEGKTPPTLRSSWENDHFERLLRNAIEWGLNPG